MSKPQTESISFSDFESQRIAVTQLGPNVYRLEWTPIVLGDLWEDKEQDIELYLGDTIETQTRPEGTLVFLRVLERAKFRHYSWVVSKEFFNSTQIYEFGALVEAVGGRWEGLMEGLLLVHLPFASNFDVEIELDHYIEMAMKRYGST